MANEVSKWSASTAVSRQRAGEIDEVYHHNEVAEARVSGIGQVTEQALYKAMTTQLLRRQAEQMAPDGAEHYAMLALAGTMSMAEVIAGLRRPS